MVEAFEEVLDLRHHLPIPHGLGCLVDVHHHGPLEVRPGAGYCVQTLERVMSPGSGGSSAPGAGVMVDPGCGESVRSRTLGHLAKAATIGPLPGSASLTQWRQGAGGACGGAIAGRGRGA